MTTLLQQADQNGGGKRQLALPGRPQPDGRSQRRLSWFAREPAWPIIALLAGWPLWWALGIGDYMPVVLAIPMIHRMYRWRANRERAIRVPPGFGLWALFLIVMLAGTMMLTQTAPGTVASPVLDRLISWSLRALSYFAVTIVLLYAGNLTEREFPRRRLAWLLGLLGLYTVAGGLGGVIDPHFQFTSPFALVVPASVQASNATIQMMLHPGMSQVSNLLGYAEGRPRAPFDYTNMWGNCLAILLPWLLVGWWFYGTRRQRRIAMAVLVIAFVPVAYSLDRGLWVGLAFGVCYLAVRFALQGRIAMLGVICGTLLLAGVVVLVTPLQNLISQRLDHGKSDASRTSLSILAIKDAAASPLLGYGDTRHQQGSTQSIAVGRSASCRDCGERDVGGNGQLWLLLITTGFTGTAFYLGFFGYGVWRFRRDRTPYGMAGILVLLLGFVFGIVYQETGAPLAITMLSYALLWRNDRALRGEEATATGETTAAEADGHPGLPVTGQRAITGGAQA